MPVNIQYICVHPLFYISHRYLLEFNRGAFAIIYIKSKIEDSECVNLHLTSPFNAYKLRVVFLGIPLLCLYK